MTTCLVVSEEDYSYTIDTCAGVEVDLEPLEIVVEGIQTIKWATNVSDMFANFLQYSRYVAPVVVMAY